MGGAINLISTGVSMAGEKKSQREYYRALAAAADKQAAIEQAAAQRRAEYIFRSSADESKQLYADYTAAAARQKSAAASNGAGNSYTMQQIMQNSRWNWLTDENNLRQNTADSLYENNLSALLGVQASRDESAQYRTLSSRLSGTLFKDYVQRMLQMFQ